MQLSVMRSTGRRLLGNLTDTDFTDANMNASLNDYYHRFVADAIMASGEWRVSGDIATADLVADQAEYTLPLTESANNLITIERIEVNITGGTNTWGVVRIVDDREKLSALSNTASVTSGSMEVYLHNGSMFFINAPATSITDGLKIWYSKEPTELSGDTDETFLPEGVHIGLIYGACLDFSIERKLFDQVKNFKTLLEEKKEENKNHYANRTKIRRQQLVPRTERYS